MSNVPDNQSTLPLPIWIVVSRDASSPPPHESRDEPRHALAFSNLESLVGFLQSRQAGAWRLEHVLDPQGLLMLVADLHRIGVRVIGLDPKPDGSGGTAFKLGATISRG
jgi:hypothetical protein